MVAKMEERSSGKRATARKGGRGQEKGGKGESQNLLDVWKGRTHCSVVSERWQQEFVRH